MNYTIQEFNNEKDFENEFNCFDFDVIDFVFSNQKLNKGYIITLPIEFSVELEEFFKTILQSNSIISFQPNENSTVIAIDSF